jgi:hypothetical protein
MPGNELRKFNCLVVEFEAIFKMASGPESEVQVGSVMKKRRDKRTRNIVPDKFADRILPRMSISFRMMQKGVPPFQLLCFCDNTLADVQ